MGMARGTFHPNSYLAEIRNIRRGLMARTLVLNVLEKHSVDAKSLAGEAEIGYGVVIHHLKLLKAEGIVDWKGGKKPHVWALTGAGQKRLLTSS
jgi:predicted ArsR family transcriptional regulator